MSHSVARRCLPAVLAGALLLPLGVAAQQVFVNGPVQLYAGPAPGYPAIATLYPGAELSVVGCLADWQWCDVLLPDGLRGWVFAPNLSYAWMGNALPVPQYGPAIGIPLIGFAVGDYWGRHYRHQPWYDDSRWRAPPPPPVRVLPPPRDGWQAPFPPRWEREATPPPRWGRDPRWDAPPPRHDMGEAPRPQREITLPPRFERDPVRPGTPYPQAAPRPDSTSPDGGRPFPPRAAPGDGPRPQFDAPRPAAQPAPGAPFGAWGPSAAPRPDRVEPPRPPRDSGPSPAPRPIGEPNRGPGGRPADGPRPGGQ